MIQNSSDDEAKARARKANTQRAGLIRAGYDPEVKLGRRAGARTCDRCGRPTMRGLDADWAAFERTLDPGPLSPLGEALALLAGRQTFELAWMGDRYEIWVRDSQRIKQHPAGTNGVDILVNHECNSLIHWSGMGTQLRGPDYYSARKLPIDPPF